MKKIMLNVLVEGAQFSQPSLEEIYSPGYSKNPLTTPVGVISMGHRISNVVGGMQPMFGYMGGVSALPASMHLNKDGLFTLNPDGSDVAVDTFANLVKLLARSYGEEAEVEVVKGPYGNDVMMHQVYTQHAVFQITFHRQFARPVRFEKRDDKWCVWNRRDGNWLEVIFSFSVPGSFSLGAVNGAVHVGVEACGQNIGLVINEGGLITMTTDSAFECELDFTSFSVQDTNKLLDFIVVPDAPKEGEHLKCNPLNVINFAGNKPDYLG
jgi:hypothetical protein